MSKNSLTLGPWRPCTENGNALLAQVTQDMFKQLLACPEEPQAELLLQQLIASSQEAALRTACLEMLIKSVMIHSPGSPGGALALRCLFNMRDQGWRFGESGLSIEDPHSAFCVPTWTHSSNLERDVLPSALLCLKEMGFPWKTCRKKETRVLYLLNRTEGAQAIRLLRAFSESDLLPDAQGVRPSTLAKQVSAMMHLQCDTYQPKENREEDRDICAQFGHYASRYVYQTGGPDLMTHVMHVLSVSLYQNERCKYRAMQVIGQCEEVLRQEAHKALMQALPSDEKPSPQKPRL